MAEEKDVRSLRVAVEIAAVMCRYQENASERIVEIVDAALSSGAQEAQLRVLREVLDRYSRCELPIADVVTALRSRIEKDGPL